MIRLYDTKQRKKVDFVPREEGKVAMYVCGPTVYNRIHVGNARTFIAFDTIRRYLEWRGFDVTFVQNVTDVDDKIIARAQDEGRTAAEVADEYTKAFIEDMHAVDVKDPSIRPKATEEIPAMLDLVQKLIDTGHAYEVEGDVYFSVRSDPHYGSLSGRNIDEMEAGHRQLRGDSATESANVPQEELPDSADGALGAGAGLADRKREPFDFALWKAAKPGEPSWESPWGMGRPGWHIECSAMSEKYLGLPFDIHGGGADLVFPHHENEQAQSQCACEGADGSFANYWMHSGMLQINSEKMSKSLGNFMLLADALETARPEALRMLTLQTHYRSPLDFSDARLHEADAALSRIENALANVDWVCEGAGADAADAFDNAALGQAAAEARKAFTAAMDDDFNAPVALGEIFKLVSEINTAAAAAENAPLSVSNAEMLGNAADEVVELLGVLGVQVEVGDDADSHNDYPPEVIALAVEIAGYAGDEAGEAVQALLDARAKARSEKDWGTADKIRDELAPLGFTIEDTAQGAKVNYSNPA